MSAFLESPTFLTTPSNAQVLQSQRLDAAAASESKKYLLYAAALGLVVFVVLRLKK